MPANKPKDQWGSLPSCSSHCPPGATALHAAAREGKALPCAALVVQFYRWAGSETIRSRVRRLVTRMEGGPGYSLTIREILRRFYRLDIGLYSLWPHQEKPSVLHPGTVIGRYSYIAETVRTFTRNHPMNTRSTHAFFYNPALGRVKAAPIAFNTLTIGNGVSIGHQAIILYPTARIGDGAMIAPGSVVYSNVPPYAVVSGFPARVTGCRFSKETIAELHASRWWEQSPTELASDELAVHPLRDGIEPWV